MSIARPDSERQQVQWARIIRDFQIDEQYFRIRPLRRMDMPKAHRLFSDNTPYLKNSSVHFLHDIHFFQTEVALDENWEKDSIQKSFFIGVIERISDKKIVMVFSSKKETYDLLIQNMATVIDPEFRGQKISLKYAEYLDKLYESSGAEYAYGVTTTKHTVAQKLSLDFGWKCGGVLPGLIRRHMDDASYFRDTNVFMYKFYNNGEKKLAPLSDCKIAKETHDSIHSFLKRKALPSSNHQIIPKPYSKKEFSWPLFSQDFTAEQLKIRFRPMDQKDISKVARLYQKHCPYFKGSAAQYLLEESFFEESACHLSNWKTHSSKRNYFIGVIERIDTHKIIGAFGSKKIPFDSIIQNIAVIIDPTYRNNSIGTFYTQYLDQVWQRTGVDIVFGLVTTQHVLSQKIFFQTVGCTVSAVLPGIVRRSQKDGSHYRDTQVYMFKEFYDPNLHCVDLNQCQIDPRSIEQAQALLKQMQIS